MDRFLQRTEARLRLEIPVSLDIRGVEGDLARLKAAAAATKVEVPVKVDTQRVDTDVDRTLAKVRTKVASKPVKMSFDLGGIKKFGSALSALAGVRIGQIQAIFEQVTFLIARAAAAALLIGPPLLLAGAAALALAPAIAAAIPALFAAAAVVGVLALGGDRLIKAFQPLAKVFEGLQKEIGRILSEGIQPLVRSFAKVLQPVLAGGLSKVARAVNFVLKGFLKFAASTEAMDALYVILRGVATAVRSAGDAVVPLTRALLQITVAALPAFQRLISFLTFAAIRFADFINEASKSGQLKTTINKAMRGLQVTLLTVGEILGSLIRLFVTLGPVVGPVFGFLGQLLVQVVDGLRAGVEAAVRFAKTIDFKAGLAGFQQVVSVVQQVRLAVFGLVATIVTSVLPTLVQFGKAIGPGLLVFFQQFAGGLQQIYTAIATFVQAVAPIIGEILVKIGTALGPGLAQIGTIINTQVAPAFAELVRALTPVVQFILRAISGQVIPQMQALVGVVSGVLTVLAGLFRTVAAILQGDWGKAWQGIKQIVVGACQVVLSVVRGAMSTQTILVRVGLGALQALWSGAWNAIKAVAAAAWSGIKSTVKSGVVTVISLLTGIPPAAVRALGNLGPLLVGAGRQLIEGLIRGIRSGAGAVADAARGVARDAVNAAKSALGIASPSKVAKNEIGLQISRGIAQGIAKGGASVQSALNTVVNAVARMKDKGALRVAQGFEKAILRLNVSRTAVTDKLTAALSKLAEVKKAAADYVTGVRSSFAQLGNISQFENVKTFQDITKALQAQVSAAQEFASTIRQLRFSGLNTATLDQLIQAGPEQALAAARTILKAGDGGVKQINSLVGKLTKAGTDTGVQGAAALYGAGVQAAQGLVDGLKSQQAALVKAMQDLARSMLAAIRKELKIKSPSQVMRDQVGKWIPAGIAEGIDSNVSSIGRSVARASRFTAASFPDTGGAATGPAGSSINYYGPVYTVDPDELARAQVKRQRDAQALHGVSTRLVTV